MGFSPGAPYVTGGHDQGADIAVVTKAKARWLRMDCFDNGNATVDAGVRAAVAAGLNVLLIINNQSAYSAGSTAYAACCTTVVKRYAPMGVHAFELVNEPNGGNPARLTTAQYVALLPSAIAAVRAADPSATILAGALAPCHEPTDPTPGVGFVAYGKAIIDSGAKYDVFSCHPYAFPNLPVSQPDKTWQSFSKMQTLHDYAAAKRDSRPFWATEFGVNLGGSCTEAMQAASFSEVATFMKANAWLELVFWFCIRDGAAGMDHFGAVRADATERPVLTAMTSALA
jgi:hypothetical protein